MSKNRSSRRHAKQPVRARSRRTLNARFVATATAKDKKQFEHFDASCPGLILRVYKATGKRTWTLNFLNPVNGKRARMKIGPYPAIQLAGARERAYAAQEMIADGKDPRVVHVAPVLKTMKELVDEYMAMHAEKLRSGREIKRVFDRNVLPVVGDVPVRDFRIPHLNKVIDPIVLRGSSSQGALTFRLIRGLINFAVSRGEIEYSPIAKAKSPKPGAPRERFLTLDEIRIVWRKLPSLLADSDHVPTILRLCLATGQRVSEVAGMRRDEVDLAREVWTIPAARSKNKHAHPVPLCGLALGMVQTAMEGTNSDFLFPNASGDGPTLHRVVDRAIRRAQQSRVDFPLGKFGIQRWTPHDLRRTISTQASIEENGLRVADTYMDHVLNHRSVTKQSVRQRHYNHNAFLNEKRAALAEWDQFLQRLVNGEASAPMAMAAE